ncbi:tudor domain-containing protein 5 isoform X1 [Hydra vulgaris]|uniref:tudor domain-containing protein 5 isoform X1 n=1 Tax=Hydra vulgaris TaxID=6087 RepID=UPI000640CABD|nr:tudor domain-containing protein 5 [Hydra vulgaris]
MKENLEEVKKIVRSLLLSAKQGLTINQLCSEYTDLEHKTLPYKEFGYNSAISFMKSMPDVVRPVFLSRGDMVLQGVADESTAHIKELVQRQRSTGRNSNIVAVKQVRATKNIIPSFVRVKISEVIHCFPKGCSSSVFDLTCQKKFGKKIDPSYLGLPTLKAVLDLCPDIVSTKICLSELFIYPASKKSEQKPPSLKPPSQDTFKQKKINFETPKVKSGIPEDIKKEVYVVLSKHSSGIWSNQFQIKFKEVHKKEFDYQKFGFSSIIEFMSKLPDFVLVHRPVVTGDWILMPIHIDMNKNLSTPNDVVSPNSHYSNYNPGAIGDLVEVYISHIIDPSSFWFQCVTLIDKLTSLMNDMNAFYEDEVASKDYEFTLSYLKAETVCCAQYEDGEWYRAIIKNVLSPSEVEVFYVDYGNEMVLDILYLRLMKKDFMTLPVVANLGFLDGVLPYDLKKWSKEAIKRFFELTSDKYLYGKIMSKEKSISLELVDTNNTDDVYIAEVLLENNLATDNEIPKVSESIKSYTNDCSRNNHLEPKVAEKTTTVVNDFVKNFQIDEDMLFTVIHYKDQAWLTSLDISKLFWDGGDILRQMLSQKKLSFENDIISESENENLFSVLKKMNNSGVGFLFRSHFTVYKVSSLLQICSIFKCRKAHYLVAINSLVKDVEKEEFWQRKLNENELKEEEAKLKLMELKFKRKRLHYGMMTNTASEKTLDDLRLLENNIKELELNLKKT